MSIESVVPYNHLILCRPLLLPPSVFPSIRVFSNESVLRIRWSKYWSFSFSISPSSEHSGLISFRMDWLDLLAVQGTLKSLLQHHSSKASILWHSAFFIVQLSHPHMTTGKTIALTRQTFVSKVMCCLGCLWASYGFSSKGQTSFNFMAAVTICRDFGTQENKVSPCFHCFPIYFPWCDGARCHDLSFWMLSFQPAFVLSSFTFIKRLFSSSSHSAIRVVSSVYLRLLVFLPEIGEPIKEHYSDLGRPLRGSNAELSWDVSEEEELARWTFQVGLPWWFRW